MAGHDHVMVGRARDRAGEAFDKALCARPRRNVHVARVRWVCTWCTRLSFNSMHCSESLFGTLFMSIVH